MANDESAPGTFDETVDDFVRLGEHLWHPLGAALAERSAPAGGDRVLDACCGDGASAIPAAHAVGTSGHVDAVDVSAPLLQRLEHTARDLPQLRTHCADVTHWEPGGYDLVHCGLGAFFFPDMHAGTEHLVQRVRPGGRIAVSIWRHGAVVEAARHLRAARTVVLGVEPPPPRSHLMDQIDQPGSYRDWLLGLGLEGVEVTVHEHRVPMTPRIAWLVIVGSAFSWMLNDLSAPEIAAVKEAYLASVDAGPAELDATMLIGVGTRSR